MDLRQHSATIFPAFAVAHSDLFHSEIKVLDTQPQGFRKTQAGPVQEACHKIRRAGQP
jgi:hypothetical protein